MLAFSAVHALWLLLLSFWLLNWHFVHWDEGELIQFGPILKKLVAGWEEKPAQEDFMFINVSYDNQLVDYYDKTGFPLGNEPITDREKLSEFISRLSKADNHKAILFDIRFDLPSDMDPTLQGAFDSLDRYLVSNHQTNGIPDIPVLNVQTGISDYPIVGGSFFKFQYFYYDSLKTVPVLLHEIIHNKSYTMGSTFFSDGSNRYFNTFLTDLLVRPHDIFTAEDRYFYENMGNLLFLDEDELGEITRDKLIIVGDFEKHDTHETLLGKIPGPMILLNAYLTLDRGLNEVRWSYILYLFLCYFFLSLIIFIPGDPLEEWLNKISGNSNVASALAGIFSYFIIIILIVLSSYFLFTFLLNILWLTFYLYFIDKVIRFIYSKAGIHKKKNLPA